MARRGSRGLHLDYHALHARYVAGESGVVIARELGIDFTGLYASWKRRGLPIRSAREAARLTADQDPERARRLIEHATRVRRGSHDSLAVREARARTRERRLIGASALEDQLAARLTELGIEHVRQKAIGPYNVDFAIPSQMLVIEVQGGGYSPEVWAKRPARRAFIEAAGWRFIDVHRRQRDWIGRAVNAVLDDRGPI